jgi:hypothetical protein
MSGPPKKKLPFGYFWSGASNKMHLMCFPFSLPMNIWYLYDHICM